MAQEPTEFRTRWSVLEKLHGADAEADWAWFIQRYRDYIGAVLVRTGLRPHEVGQAIDEFWSYLFGHRVIARADRSGRFRSFLSGVVRNYVHVWRRENTARDDGAVDAARLACEPLTEHEDAALWATQILHLALSRLEQDRATDAQVLRWFYGLPAGHGQPAGPRIGGSEIARRIDCKQNAVHQRMARARDGLRQCITEEVAATIGSTRDLGDELALLLAAIGRTAPGIVETTDPAQDAHDGQ